MWSAAVKIHYKFMKLKEETESGKRGNGKFKEKIRKKKTEEWVIEGSMGPTHT